MFSEMWCVIAFYDVGCCQVAIVSVSDGINGSGY